MVAFDWDSLGKEPEPALVGSTAHAFCSDWSRADHVQAPTLDEARAFVSAYEAARERPFDADERKLCGTAFAYSVAYSARCAHALGRDERRQPGTFQHLVSTHSRGLLDLQRYWGAEVSGHDEVRPSPDFEVPDQQTGGVRRRAPGSRRVSDPALGRALDERE